MLRRSFAGAVSVSILFGLAACGGGSDNGPSFSTTIDSATAAGIAQSAVQFVNDVQVAIVDGEPASPVPLAKGATSLSYADRLVAFVRGRAYARAHRDVPTGAPLAVAPGLAAPFSKCVPTITGIDADSLPVDTDGDGVPDDYTVTFPDGCTDADSAGAYTTTYAGSIRIRDVDALLGFRLDITGFKVRGTQVATGDYEQVAENGSESALF
ncbi:MAG TPA: hypothetical protein VFI13_12295, partial [Gemmatimonadales bacterium]|nr:hypothetical protein [Gemmatimonadales bacterium]